MNHTPTVTVAELIEGRSATHLTGDRPIWQDAGGRAFAIASGPCGPWVPEACNGEPDPEAPIMQADDATPEAPLVWCAGMDGLAALGAMGLVVVEE
ncbi:hypothetical protein [Roseinatronobacter sp. NSM]|uniref:hypothetical protein n=1 Tax=Roseinatronobacter sp. NSM TaxID=3457785 RepID=UPI0040351F27